MVRVIDKEYYPNLGAKIKDLRILSGLSIPQLAHHIKVTHQQFRKYEIGCDRIPVERLEECAKFFGKSMDYFTGKHEISMSLSDRMDVDILRIVRRMNKPQKQTLIKLAKLVRGE